MWNRREALTVVAIIGAGAAAAYVACNMSLFKLKQAINVPALKMLGHVVSDPRIAVPLLELKSLRYLDVAHLQSKGVKCIIFDKDNTLWYELRCELNVCGLLLKHFPVPQCYLQQ
jgi:hypothetical protein